MARIKPFKGLRPPKEIVRKVVSRPYDVLNSNEARLEAEGNEKSLYRIIKPEIDFSEEVSEYAPVVYERAVENFIKFQDKGWLVQDNKEQYYIYAQTMNNKTQYGLVVCVHIDDYLNGKIKKHELTRKDKEEDRMKHVVANNANIEPVFFTYPDREKINELVSNIIQREPEYDFVTDDNIGHHFWVVDKDSEIDSVTALFEEIPNLYVADGHHRSAAATLAGLENAKKNPLHNGTEEYNYFMAVCFPSSQLSIIDYNRLIKDLNGLDKKDFIQKLEKYFVVEYKGSELIYPLSLHNITIYLDGECYSLIAKEFTYNDNDAIEALDVTISSKYILDEILNIKDLRTDKRIDFVGGIRGLKELENRVDTGEMKLAIVLYPVTINQLIKVADTGNIMPPKTTWFEPKLRSGIVIHKLD